MTVLLVAATGGHLAQLDRLAPRIAGATDDDATWVTFDTPQSRSLLKDRRCVFVPYIGPRDIRRAVLEMPTARTIIREARPALVVSTGNAVAVSFLPVARALRVSAAYIESAARADGPSLTGRIVRWIPGVSLFSQYRGWALGPWHYIASVFDEFMLAPAVRPLPVKRVVVTLGTIDFGFRRLVERLIGLLPDDCNVVWQVGSTDVDGLGIDSRRTMAFSELAHEMRHADLVVAHAGIGSALAAMDAGKCPVLVPREQRCNEHVDDHQRQIALALEERGLAVSRSVSNLRLADLIDASSRTIQRRTDLPTVDLRAGAAVDQSYARWA